MKHRVIVGVAALLAIALLSGVSVYAKSEYFGVPNKALGYPEEFDQTDAAIAKAEKSPGARYCPEKIAQAKELVAKLMGLHRRYTTPTPVTMMDFFGKAKYQVLNDGTVQFSAAGFMQANDRATFWFDQQSHQPRRFKFSSSLEGAAVEGLVEYTKVAFGPTYAGRTTLKVPGKKMSAKIENFDFIKQ